jgi:putative hydrolase of the HAD superfamily
VLREWRCSGTLEDLLRAWTAIEVDADVVRLIGALRTEGVTCCLATDQEPFRGRYLAETLGYGTLFDREFYSCGLGFCKPDPDYSIALLERLGRSRDETLFLDDMEAITTAAVGIRSELFVPPPGTRPVDEMRRILRRNGLPLSG